MIFMTVGTHHFDALTRCLDEAAGNGLLVDEALLQIGHGGDYLPRHCRYFKIAPTLEPFEQAANLVIGHGGTGTTLEILRLGKPLISVANPMMQDNHQDEFLSALERQELVHYCRDLNQLPEMIARGMAPSPKLQRSCTLAQVLSELIQSTYFRPVRKRTWLRRLANWFAAGYEIDTASTIRRPSSHDTVWELVVDPRKPPSPNAATNDSTSMMASSR